MAIPLTIYSSLIWAQKNGIRNLPFTVTVPGLSKLNDVTIDNYSHRDYFEIKS